MFIRFNATAAAVATAISLPSGPAGAAEVQQLAAVVVTATRTPQALDEVLSDATVIERDEIERAGQMTVGELLALQPGVEMTTTGGPGGLIDVFIRGTKSAQTAVLVDGLRLINPTDGASVLHTMPLSAVERIEIVRGPMSALYGSGAIGGVIQIFTRAAEGAPRASFSIGAGSYKTLRSDAGYGGQAGDTRFRFGVSYESTRGFSASKPGAPAFVFEPDRDGYHTSAANGRLSQRLAPGHEIGLDYMESRGKLDLDLGVTGGAAPQRDNLTRVASVYANNEISANWRSELRYGTTDIDYAFLDAGFTFAPRISNPQFSWINHVTVPLGALSVGVERQHQKVSGDGVDFTRSDRTIRSVFTQFLGEWGRHSLSLNARRDRWSDFGGTNTGSAGYAFRPTASLQLGITASRAFRAPTFDDLFYPFFSNPDLRPERSRGVDVAARYRTAGGYVALVHFRNRIHDAIELDGSFFPQNVEARITGTTLNAARTWGGFTLRGSMTRQNPRDAESGGQLARRSRNFGNLAAEYRRGPWNAGCELQFQDERFDTRSNSAGNRMGGYALANLFAQYRVAGDWTVFGRLNNLADREYELAQNFATPGRNVFIGVRYQAE